MTRGRARCQPEPRAAACPQPRRGTGQDARRAPAGGSVLRGRWQAQQAMKRALLLDPGNPFVLSLCSEAALYSAGDIDHAASLLERALQRDPNDANGLALLGNLRRLVGDDPRIGLGLIDQAKRLSPRDPRSAFWHHHAAWCHWKLGDLAAMEAEARRGLELYRGSPWSWVCLTCALGLQDRREEAREAAAALRELMPTFSAGRFYWLARFFYGRRFNGPVQAGYAELRRVLKAALD